MAARTALQKARISLDRSIDRMRKQLAELAPFLGKGRPTRSLEEFDLDTERLISELLGQTSELLHAYEYPEMGEAAGLVNMTDEAPESAGMDGQRQSVLQRSRVLESCVAEFEARRAADPKGARARRQTLIGPQVAEHMTTEIQSLPQDASLREAGRTMQKEAGLAPSHRQTVVRRVHHRFDTRARSRCERRRSQHHPGQSLYAIACGGNPG